MALVLAAAGLLGASGCTVAPRVPDTATSTPATPTATTDPGKATSADTTARPGLAESFAELSASLPGTAGVAFGAVGSDEVTVLGDWTSGVAWSTIKVPLAIAATRVGGSTASAYAVPAITQSDNAAAETLWQTLGPPADAAAAVQAVLAEGGDTQTVVQQQRVRPQFTAFGQTEWSLRQQARFAAGLPCVAGGTDVLGLMANLATDQVWGLASLPGAATKGGWGPGEDGRYLVRQFGVLPTAVPAHTTAVAVAVQPSSGSFTDGIAMIGQVAVWLSQHSTDLPAGGCAR